MTGEETLPCFVLDITIDKIRKQNVAELLKNNSYSFFYADGEPTVNEDELYYLFAVQGGGIEIIVICHDFQEIIGNSNVTQATKTQSIDNRTASNKQKEKRGGK